MGINFSGVSEEQTTCSYNKKQHEECKKSVNSYEQMINDYKSLITKAKNDQDSLKFKIAELEADLNQSNTISEEQEAEIKNLEKRLKDYEQNNKEIKDLKNKLSKAEADLIHSDSRGDNLNQIVWKLENRINRLRIACPSKELSTCNRGEVYKILQERFTPKRTTCVSTIMYCIIALVLGILIWSWLFGSHKQSVYRETVRDVIVEPEPISEIEYKQDQ